MNRKGFTLIEALIVVVVLGLIVAIVWPGTRAGRARDACLSKGFPEIRFGGFGGPFWGTPYCVKRLNQTDIVARLDTLK